MPVILAEEHHAKWLGEAEDGHCFVIAVYCVVNVGTNSLEWRFLTLTPESGSLTRSTVRITLVTGRARVSVWSAD